MIEGVLVFGVILVGALAALWLNVRRPPPRGSRVSIVGPCETVRGGFAVRTETSISTNTTPPFGRVHVTANQIWFTGPRGSRGWALEREGATIERRRLQWIVDGYRLADGSLKVDVAPGRCAVDRNPPQVSLASPRGCLSADRAAPELPIGVVNE